MPRAADIGLSDRERRGLAWVRTWARGRLTSLKRLRKHTRHQPVIPPGEAEVLTALFDLEDAARRLIDGTQRQRGNRLWVTQRG
jgi:hypothetical protein